ncbi:MAG: hypothetical protein KAH00_01330 [Cocleimonas sp.]|nr:hypothetical protein [Cocleimonas sp.]
MLIRTFIMMALFMLFSPIQAVSSESALSVRLQQAVDANCDGISDHPFSSDGPFIILPQQCVNYKITAENHSNQALSSIILTGKIPPYTQLKPNSLFVYEKGTSRPAVTSQSVNSAQVKAELTTLAPLKTMVMVYSVLIN